MNESFTKVVCFNFISKQNKVMSISVARILCTVFAWARVVACGCLWSIKNETPSPKTKTQLKTSPQKAKRANRVNIHVLNLSLFQVRSRVWKCTFTWVARSATIWFRSMFRAFSPASYPLFLFGLTTEQCRLAFRWVFWRCSQLPRRVQVIPSCVELSVNWHRQ